MKTVSAVIVLLCLGVACAERTFPLRSLAARAAAGENQAYWFLGAPRKGSNTIQAIQVPADFTDDENDDDDGNYGHQAVFAIVQDDDEDENSPAYDNEEDNFQSNDDDEDSELSGTVIGMIPLNGGNAIFSRRKDNSGLMELEERNLDEDDDEESAIYLPRRALEGIPRGSVVALVDDSEGRAIRYYRRRRVGPQRRRGNGRRRRRGGNRRRGRPTIRVISGGQPNRRVGNRRPAVQVIRA